jgi:hypothetical protein
MDGKDISYGESRTNIERKTTREIFDTKRQERELRQFTQRKKKSTGYFHIPLK